MYNKGNKSAPRDARHIQGQYDFKESHLVHQYTSKDIARFWSKVNKDGSIPAHRPELGVCWEWTAGEKVKGLSYGGFGVNGKTLRSHRVVWELTFGQIPNGLLVLHACDNRKCCNPSHLFLGTQAANMKDMAIKGRQPLGEKNGLHKLTNSQVNEIRLRYAAGGITQRELGYRFGVSHAAIGYIVRHETWNGAASE